ncbi:MAG TPA: inositol monophosphatase family protein [Gemmataceae bacterium]|nr:inositol monophosphatase family protein [Pirellulales bacterium]HZZ79588.1 inositol monophosphatase family protein [Gemmataceae bacterium]
MALIAEFGKICERAARAGGQVLREHAGRVEAREKKPADLVTEADVASQRTIRDTILAEFPGHGFLGEENESIPPGPDGLRWIVDPLDGTTNFVHGIPEYAVSIGLEQNGKLVVGVVYAPVYDACYLAAAGEGAFLNREPLKASRTTDLSQAVVATSFPPRANRNATEVQRFLEVLPRCRATRRTGSSALNLCSVAAGRFDAFWSYDTKPWDVAAGALIVREAGGILTGPGGGDFNVLEASFVAAATRQLHRELCQVLATAGPGK